MPDPNQQPQQGPVLGKPILSSYPTPDIAARIYRVVVDSRKADYKVPEPGSRPDAFDPDSKLKDFVFAKAVPTDEVGMVAHWYLNERLNEDDYNYSIEFPWVSEAYPRVIRTYVTLREKYVPPSQSDVDPKNSDLALVEMKVTRSEDQVIDALFIAVQKVFERLPGPQQYEMRREDASMSYQMRTAVPLKTTVEFQDGPAVAANADVVTDEQDWGATAQMVSAFKRAVTRLKRVIPPGGKILNLAKRWTKDMQIATVTETLKEGAQTITPRATLIDASVEDHGNNTSTKLEVEVDEVFPETEYSAEINDLVPPEFRDLVPTRTFAETTAGDAVAPTLSTGELSETQRQQTELIKRVSITSRDLSSLPATRVDYEIGEDFGFGGAFEIEKTLAATALALEEGIGITDSFVKNLGNNIRSRSTKAVAASTPDLRLTAGGGGYIANPSVSFSGGTGSGAVAVAVIGKSVASVTINSGGSGYRWAPAVRISGGEGGGASGVAVLSFGLATIVMLTKGSGYTSLPTVVITGGGGTGATATAVRGYGVGSISVTSAGSGYSTPPAVSFSGGGGNGATAQARLGFGVTSVTIGTGGSGYTSDPTVIFTGDGTGAAGTALRGYAVASASVTNAGSGYTSNPSVGFSGGGGTGAEGTVTRSFGVDSVEITNIGSGYSSPPAVSFSGGGGSGAAGDAVIGYPVDSIAVDDGGSGYDSAPAVVITGDGLQADATATLGFGLDSIVVDEGGSGYTTPPTVVIDGDGTGATATAVLTGDVVTGVTIDDPGEGYTTEPTISFVGDGTGADALAQLSALGSVKEVNLFNSGGGLGGSGYTEPPDISFTGGSGSGAAATATLATTGGFVARVDITTPGTGYTSAPTVGFSGGGGTSAAATSTLSTTGVISGIAITNGGSKYTTAPTIAITGGGGTGATATAVLSSSGVIIGVTITNAGSGYSVAPTLSFSGGGGSGATATAILATTGLVKDIAVLLPGTGYTSAPTVSVAGNATATSALGSVATIESVTVTAAGSGYTTPPTIAITGGGGSGATARATLAKTGVVKSVTVTHAGAKFRSVPTVSFSGGYGTGAAATAVLSSSGPVIELTLTANGSYTVEPTVVFTPAASGPGSGAAATYVLGTARPWPVLYESDTDPAEGIVVNMVKKIVPAGTKYPGEGNPLGSFVDIKALDKWRSVQIASAIDISTLPDPLVYSTMHPLNLPDRLQSIEVIWRDTKGNGGSTHFDSGGGKFSEINADSTTGAAILVKRISGFRGEVLAEVTRTYYLGAPLLENIPEPTIIQAVSGTAAIFSVHTAQALGVGFQKNKNSSGSRESQQLIDVTHINDVLTGNYYIIGEQVHQAAPVNAASGDFSTGFVYQTLYPEPGYLEIDLPYSTPGVISPGDVLTFVRPLEKWRFGVFVQEVVRVVVPNID